LFASDHPSKNKEQHLEFKMETNTHKGTMTLNLNQQLSASKARENLATIQNTTRNHYITPEF
jgi:hypothetical protein